MKSIWTLQKCKEVAKDCKTRWEFGTKFPIAYKRSCELGWLDEVCLHMKIVTNKPAGYWTLEKCIEVAKDCKNMTDFHERYGGAYTAVRKNKWKDKILPYLKKLNRDDNIWLIYSYHINFDYVYIGVTNDEKRRKSEHKRKHKSAVYEFIEKNNIKEEDVHYKIEVKDIHDEVVALELEIAYEEWYRNEGFTIINKDKCGGSLGGGIIKWTIEECTKVAKQCTNTNEFKEKFLGAYKASFKFGIFDKICAHMTNKCKPKGYWTEKRCAEEALKYKTIKEFREKSNSAYSKAIEYKWLYKICSHMKIKIKIDEYWTKEKCKEKALECKHRSEFREKYTNIYNLSSNNGWLDEFFPKNKQK